jgi:hypothetical protein
MESNKVVSFKSLSENVGRFDLKNKTFLVPQMNTPQAKNVTHARSLQEISCIS